MLKIKQKFMYDDDGKQVGVILALKDFEKCVTVLEDYQDYKLLEESRGSENEFIPLEDVIRETVTRMKR